MESYSPFSDCDDAFWDYPLDDVEVIPQFQEDNDPYKSQPSLLGHIVKVGPHCHCN